MRMDTVDYIGARGWQIKGIHHLLNWTLIVPLLMLTSYTDSSNQTETVISGQGDTALFPWTDEIPPFHLIEWYFEKTQLAEASESSFKQGTLNINKNYKSRFRLHKPGNATFILTKVDNDDKGNYQCIITLQSTDIQKQFNWTLEVKGERTTITPPTPTGDTSMIVLGVLIPFVVIALLLGVLGFLYWGRKKRKSNQITQDSEASTPMPLQRSQMMEVEPKVI